MKKKQLVALMALAALISACSLSDDDNARIDQAEDNLEKLALEPVITYPAENSTVNMITEVRVDTDESVDYKKLILLVNGVEVAEDTEAPYSFQWNPYFAADGSEASLLVKAVTTSGNSLRSKATKMIIDRSFEVNQFVLSEVSGGEPTRRSFPYGTAEISLAWNEIYGADMYELSAGAEVISSEAALANISLVEGENSTHIRARAAGQWGQWIELGTFWVYPPEAPNISATYDAGVVQISTTFADALDPSVIALVVNGEQALLLDEAPFELSWDPYFWASAFSVEWWITATLSDGRVIQSDSAILDKEASGVFDRIQISLPEGGPNYLGVDALLINWTDLTGASRYEYELENSFEEGVTEVASQNQVQLIGLDEGAYSLRVRAIGVGESLGAWSRATSFSIVAPEAPVITSPAQSTSFYNVSTFAVAWDPVEGAVGYQYRTNNGEWVAVAGLTAEVPTPNAGYFSIDVQAVDALGRTGETGSVAIDVAEPEVPVVDEVFVSWNEDKFDVSINWIVTEENTYQVRWVGLEDIYETRQNSIVIPAAIAGSYSWQLKVINAAGHESQWVNQGPLNVGVFRTELGGSKDEYGRQLLRSNMGGYLVLASTTSRELDLSVKIDSNQAAPWLLRFDESGNVINEIILPSPERIEGIVEDGAGNIYLAGYNWQEKNGLVYKLSPDFELLWRREYVSEASTDRFDITSIVSWGDGLVLAGSTWKTEGNTTSRDSYELFRVNIEDGAITQRQPLVGLSDDESVKIDSISQLKVSPNNELLIGGTLLPEDSEFYEYRAFVARMNAEFISTDRWVSEPYTFGNVGDMVFNSVDERLYIIGQADLGDIALAVLDAANLEELYVEASYTGEFFYEYGTGISSNREGGVLTLLSDSEKYTSPRPMVIVEYDELLLEISRTYLIEERGYTAESAILRNPDGSVTILFSQKDSGSNNNQLVLKRFSY